MVGVVDGDTLTIVSEISGTRQQQRLRLAEIDAPEPGQSWSTRARQALADKVFQQPVLIADDGEDRYGRMLGRVYLGDRDINREMVREGHAWMYRKYSSNIELQGDEEFAEEHGAGLWSLPDAQRVPPWAWRSGEREIDLLLQSPLAFDSPADRCAPPACTRLVKWLDGARRNIDFAIYGARNQSRVLAALMDAKRRGVRVRGYVDRTRDGDNYYTSTDDWVRLLGDIADDQERERQPGNNDYQSTCKRPLGFDGPLQCLAYDLGNAWLLAEHASREDFTDPEHGGVNKIMHNKFFVVDGRRVWTGSANLSDSGTGGYNANVVVAARSRRLAQLYNEEFERLVARGSREHKQRTRAAESLRVADAELQVLFAPQDSPMETGIRPLIASAQQSIDLAIFFLTHKRVTADLIAAHRRGVKLRVIVDATSARNGYTKHEVLRSAGVPVKVENWGGKMHAKAAVIDGEYLVLGSMNWTSAGENANDENTLLIRSTRLASRYLGWYDELWESIPHAWLARNARPDPESRDSGSACSDGADNDFDERVDGNDPGCGRMPPSLSALPPHRVAVKFGEKPPSTHNLQEALSPCSPGGLYAFSEAVGRCSVTAIATLDGSEFQCGLKRSCRQMFSCEEARFFLRECGLTRLDGDGDGIPCERLCGN